MNWLLNLGMKDENLRLRDHETGRAFALFQRHDRY